MLGRAVSQELDRRKLITLESSRSRGLRFDAERESVTDLLDAANLKAGDYVVNCLGLTKGRIDPEEKDSVERALKLNVLFPISLAREAELRNLRVIQVATDCVFSGTRGKYSESSPHDALDVYGKSKSMGEVRSEQVLHLRCSLVGPESRGRQSLFFEWVRNAARNGKLKGYINHHWNGLTSQAFGRIVGGIVAKEYFKPGINHLVPNGELTKYELIKLELDLLGRNDVSVEAFVAEQDVDRTLTTDLVDDNRYLFALAGYEHIPTIREMMEELPWGALKER